MKTFQILADVEFGVLSQKCNNFGVCRINPMKRFRELLTPLKFPEQGSTNGGVALINYLSNGELEIMFLKKSINRACQQKYFSKGCFLIEEDFNLSLDDQSAICLKNGTYPLEEVLGVYLLVVPASQIGKRACDSIRAVSY